MNLLWCFLYDPSKTVNSLQIPLDHYSFTKIKKLYKNLLIFASFSSDQKKYMCVYCHMSKKSRVGINFFFKLSAKPEIVVPSSGIRFWYFIFEISGKPSFVETVIWRVTQFFYLLCSQFRQKASGWINKTLLLIKQQKWLSEFCVKIDRVASKN